ncbi:hypothetical protein ACFOQN_02840 [Neisseria musculi]
MSKSSHNADKAFRRPNASIKQPGGIRTAARQTEPRQTGRHRAAISPQDGFIRRCRPRQPAARAGGNLGGNLCV